MDLSEDEKLEVKKIEASLGSPLNQSTKQAIWAQKNPSRRTGQFAYFTSEDQPEDMDVLLRLQHYIAPLEEDNYYKQSGLPPMVWCMLMAAGFGSERAVFLGTNYNVKDIWTWDCRGDLVCECKNCKIDVQVTYPGEFWYHVQNSGYYYLCWKGAQFRRRASFVYHLQMCMSKEQFANVKPVRVIAKKRKNE